MSVLAGVVTPSNMPEIDGRDLAWLSADEMREVDRITVTQMGVLLMQMMENAGRNLAQLAVDLFAPASATVLAGGGGNGGGGMVAARHLAARGVNVQVVSAVDDAKLAVVPRHQLAILRAMGVPLIDQPVPADLVIDAVIGYALTADPRGRQAELIEWTAAQRAPILALDLPSGLDATTGRLGTPHVRATATMTLAMPKLGLRSGALVVGDLYLADISVPRQVFAELGHEVAPIFALGSLLRVRQSRDIAGDPSSRRVKP